ncbi:MAG: thioredoxin family protein [Victivallales bacterium]|nr:thioredoxin family protein [Victivallales bacterium]
MTTKNKDKKTFLILTISAYVILVAIMIYRAQQSPGTCPFLSMCGSSAPVEAKETSAVPATIIKAIPVAALKSKINKLPKLLELGSKSCVPCQMMEPILAKLTKEYKGIIKIEFIDVWLKENVSIGKKYKINSIPVQIIFDAEGKELWRHTGFMSEENILKKWKELGYDLAALKKAKK